jgi:membrane fusion protein (multidrug efflux system)
MTRTASLLSPVLFIALALGCESKGAHGNLPQAVGSGAPPLPSVAVAVGAAASAQQIIDDTRLVVTGTAKALHEAKLGAKASGVIAAMNVEEGDLVKKGQLLFRLESAAQAIQVSQAEAALANARVAQTNAQADFERTKELFDRGSIAPAVFDQVKARFDSTKAGVDVALAQVASAKRMAADTSVHAPFDGIIAQRMANLGETVTMVPPTTVLVVQDISKLEVRARVPETALRRVREGSPVRVHFPALNADRTVPVVRINPSVDPMTRTIEIIAHVPNEDRALKAGMLVEVEFRDDAQEPASARPTGATAGSSAMRPQPRPVKPEKG